MKTSRRKLLGGSTAMLVAGISGCIGDDEGDLLGDGENGEDVEDQATPAPEETPRITQLHDPSEYHCPDRPAGEDIDGGPPLSETPLPIPACPDELDDDRVSGGPGQDGIPSIENPEFESVSDADNRFDDGDPVFGIYRDGEAKVYSQNILVWHEIVNDEIAGDPVAVTYCPLTGTAQGFERGDVEFGVSGQLLNSNLVMFDRDTETYWPQILATGINGPLTGETLQEFPVTWTTWGRWKEAFPDSQVLTEDTGYIRNYRNDPYGSYNTRSGFYSNEDLIFSPFVSEDEGLLHPKAVVIGARSEHGSLAAHKELLREERILEAIVGEVPHLVVYDDTLDTGYIYENPQEYEVTQQETGYEVDGSTYGPDSLPMDRVLRYDAMWFAWFGYYPSTKLIH